MPRIKTATALVLLTALIVACSGGGLVPPIVEAGEGPTPPPMELGEITVTVEHPYPVGIEPAPKHPGILGVTVTCIVGCESQPTKTTDQDGRVSFLGQLPLTIRAEKPGYIATERQVVGSDKLVLGHEWPPETAGSFRRLQFPPSLLLNWNEDDLLGAFYGCNVVVIEDGTQYYGRRGMLAALEHELFHAHQDATLDPDRCQDIYRIPEDPEDPPYGWDATKDGQEWIAATTADREAGRLVALIDVPGQYFWDIPAEAAAEYYSYWVRAAWPLPEVLVPGVTGASIDNLCYGGASLRCQWMEKRFGPRPDSYP